MTLADCLRKGFEEWPEIKGARCATLTGTAPNGAVLDISIEFRNRGWGHWDYRILSDRSRLRFWELASDQWELS